MVKVQTNSQGKVYLSNGNALLAGASSAVISTLSVTPTTSAQTITASGGVDGYSPINVSAVTSSIDANIVAGNIKNGVTILGVTGDYTGGGSSTKYGASIDNFLGNTVDGVLEAPIAINGLTFTGVTEIGYGVLEGKFSITSGNNIEGTVSFPDLTTVDENGLKNTFTESGITGINLSSLTTVGDYGLYESCSECYDLTGSVDLSSVTTIGYQGLYSAFSYAGITGAIDLSSLTSLAQGGLELAFSYSGITSIDISGVTTLNSSAVSNMCQGSAVVSADLSGFTSTAQGTGFGYCFEGCENLTTVDLSNLTNLYDDGLGNTFNGCISLASIDLSSLTTVSGVGPMQYAFSGCSSLANVDLSSLETIATGSNSVFLNTFENTALTTLSFPALKEQAWWSNVDLNDYGLFTDMLAGVDGCTVHFPSNLQTALGSIDDVVNGFGGTNTTVLFDLPSTANS